jgi:hypothetical protein
MSSVEGRAQQLTQLMEEAQGRVQKIEECGEGLTLQDISTWPHPTGHIYMYTLQDISICTPYRTYLYVHDNEHGEQHITVQSTQQTQSVACLYMCV